jgi:hypothetical protein
MAKKLKTRAPTSASPRQPLQSKRSQPFWRQKIFLGSAVLALVIGLGVIVRYVLLPPVLPNLQGAVDNRYTRGNAGAPVILKEFSDYT